MVPPIIKNPLETLEDMGGAVASNVKQMPKKAAGQVKQSLETGFGLGNSGSDTAAQVDGGKEAAKVAEDKKIEQMKKIEGQKVTARYQQVQREILAISQKRQQELPKQVSGKPGFSEDKMIKQLKEEKKPEVQKKAEQAEKEPISLQREKRKSEMHRGASG